MASDHKIRAKLDKLEERLGESEAEGTLENCSLHVDYWRMREALASIHVSNTDGDPNERKANYTLLRQASEHCAMWEQRRAAANRDRHLDKLAELERLILERFATGSKMDAIANSGAPKRKPGRPKKVTKE